MYICELIKAGDDACKSYEDMSLQNSVKKSYMSIYDKIKLFKDYIDTLTDVTNNLYISKENVLEIKTKLEDVLRVRKSQMTESIIKEDWERVRVLIEECEQCRKLISYFEDSSSLVDEKTTQYKVTIKVIDKELNVIKNLSEV